MIPAVAAPFKNDLRDYLKWMRHTADQCVQRGAKILLNTEATKELLDAEGYDAVVIAAGATPVIPKRIPGVDKPHVAWAPDAEMGKLEAGQNVVVVGAGSIGVEAALDFTRAGKNVTVVEMADPMTAFHTLHKNDASGAGEILKCLNAEGATMRYNTELVEIKDGSVLVRDVESGKTEELPADTVLMAVGMRPRFETVDALRHSCPETSVAIVGDCNNVAGTICEAVNQAFQACLHI